MKKVKSIKVDKIWGYEIWMYSPISWKQTTLEDGTPTTEGPLIKIIQANQPLSVQVHPDDKLAQELNNEPVGKAESWYILEAQKNAKLVIGLKNYDEQFIRESMENKTFEDNLKKIEVKPGDFIDIPAGLVHAIGAGMKLLEVQQPSDLTYRYFDYYRLENGKPRELHLDKAIKSQRELSYELKPLSIDPLTYKNSVGSQTFLNNPTVLKEDAIIINIDTEEAFVAEQGETITFNNYAIVSYK